MISLLYIMISFTPFCLKLCDSKDDVLTFSYNPQSNIGPNKWDEVNVQKSEYWDYFKERNNMCDDETKGQSPVELEPSVTCTDDHNIRSKRGKNNFDTVDFSVLPYALRATFKREKGAKVNPSNLSKYVYAAHLEVKVPSEHVLSGKRYDGELVISHIWPKSDGLLNVGVMLDSSKNKHNLQLEQFIREWEEKSREREDNCNKIPYTRIDRYPTQKEMDRIWGKRTKDKQADFDVYKLLPTVWYCGYRGGITIPPCTTSVVWRFLDLPAHLSKTQLKRIQSLIKDQKDESCKPNKVAFNGKVNRPLQKVDSQKVFCCTSANWKFSRVKDVTNEWKTRKEDWPENYHGWR